jgi:hypothetical protein
MRAKSDPAAEAAVRFATWLADPDAPDPKTHPDDPDGSRAAGSAMAAAIAMRKRASSGWRRVR